MARIGKVKVSPTTNKSAVYFVEWNDKSRNYYTTKKASLSVLRKDIAMKLRGRCGKDYILIKGKKMPMPKDYAKIVKTKNPELALKRWMKKR